MTTIPPTNEMSGTSGPTTSDKTTVAILGETVPPPMTASTMISNTAPVTTTMGNIDSSIAPVPTPINDKATYTDNPALQTDETMNIDPLLLQEQANTAPSPFSAPHHAPSQPLPSALVDRELQDLINAAKQNETLWLGTLRNNKNQNVIPRFRSDNSPE